MSDQVVAFTGAAAELSKIHCPKADILQIERFCKFRCPGDTAFRQVDTDKLRVRVELGHPDQMQSTVTTEFQNPAGPQLRRLYAM